MAPNLHRLPTIPLLSWDDCRLLVESVLDYAIFMLDVDGYVATWNAGAEKIKGYTAEEIVGRHFSTFYPEEDIAADKPRWLLEVAAKVGRVEDEGWRVRKDGSRFWANVVITALRDGSGLLRGFGKVTRDLSDRRATEERLRESEERFHSLVDAVVDYAIFMLDEQGHVTTWNVGAHRLKGYEPEEVLGQHFSVFYTPEDRERGRPEQILETVRREGRFEEEGWRVRKDGTRFWADVAITPLRDSEGKVRGFAKITRDLTERREAEENERAAAAAAQASRAKDDFLATVSHELRTPLSAILGWATILKDRVTDPEVAKPLQIIHRNAKAQVRIIDDILDVSRIIAGKFAIEPRPSNLVDIVNQAVDAVRASAAAKSVTIQTSFERQLCLLVADPERLQQVIWNLLSNSVKFTPSGGTISVSVRQTDEAITLRVSDTGVGIEPSFLPYVFDRFRQADPASTRSAGGLGLGLALVKHIVELHRGTVDVVSAGRGKGATFTIQLPVSESRPSSERPLRTADAEPKAQTTPLKGVRVLVVDDEPDARDVIVAVLEQAGAVVASAGSAREALDSYRSQIPDMILSDISMPGEDGFAFLAKLRALDGGSEVPVVALTASAREQDRARALAAGFRAHLAKPIEPAVLASIVAGFVRPK